MHDDDKPIGRLLSRREMLGLFGSAGAAFLVACSGDESSDSNSVSVGADVTSTTAPTAASTATPAGASAVASCVVKPEMTVGPYFVDQQLNRSDIRAEPSTNAMKEGVPFILAFNVSSIAASACTPLANAQVDVWHCDAAGTYSGVTDPGAGSTVGLKYLRGYQMTNATGLARFTTIYPGWYQGRAVHIHFKIRTTAPGNQAYEFTSQLFFDEALNDTVFAQAPYAAKGRRDTLNSNDSIFRSGGDQLLLAPTREGNGYTATFNIALDLSNTQVGQPDTMGGPGGGGPGGPPPGGTPPPR